MDIEKRRESAKKIADAARAIGGDHMTACADMWDWLAENPEKWKDDYPIPEGRKGMFAWGGYKCPACTMVNGACARCPLAGLWGTRLMACSSNQDSPYKVWIDSGITI